MDLFSCYRKIYQGYLLRFQYEVGREKSYGKTIMYFGWHTRFWHFMDLFSCYRKIYQGYLLRFQYEVGGEKSYVNASMVKQ